ncbi:MAG: GTPase ObgE [Acidobacteriota bacterium]
MIFVDECSIHVLGGRGGNGCLAFRREKFVPKGGPSGGDGGHGGSVFLVGDEAKNTLFHLSFVAQFAAQRGRHGEGQNKTGKTGGDLEIEVPLGTQVYDRETGELVGEVLRHGERLRVAAGGRGGKGNARFATATDQAPRRADPGTEGADLRLRLELKLLADAGVVGLPNAGKSTLISVISAARPKIADYPFTTLAPQLGVVALGLETEPFVIADLPGLIAGASEGAGLGLQFLRHVDRCRALVHLVDLSTEGSALSDLDVVERELEAFNPELLARPRFLIGSKADSGLPERRAELEAAAAERGIPYFEISSATGAGIRPLIQRLAKHLSETKVREPVAARPAGGHPEYEGSEPKLIHED